jgi:hypothetical protein
MEPKRRRELTLLALVVALAGGLYVAVAGWPSFASGLFGTSGTSANPGGASNGQGRAAKGQRSGSGAAEAPQVHLDALDADRPKPDSAGRDLFRFRPKPPPLRPIVTQPSRAADAGPSAPPGPPPPPPIALKFIGIIDAGQSKKLVAVLSDGRGSPVYGSEGETILGQYRILRIGTESIEMSYLDGRGRQTIRFTGS